jgi:hypothetical protein
MAALLASVAKAYVVGKIGGKAAGALGVGDQGTSGVGSMLGELASSGSNTPPQSPNIQQVPGGVQYYNRNFKNKKRRMF